MSLPVRKHPRLKNYDYSQCGCYHITLCTKDRKPILSVIIPAQTEVERATVSLTHIGAIAEHYIRKIPEFYVGIQAIKYVIMPNHIHILLSLAPESSVDVPTVVHALKRMITRTVGESIWQESFYDVVIKNDVMFQCEWAYIDNNPDKWAEDEMFV